MPPEEEKKEIKPAPGSEKTEEGERKPSIRTMKSDVEELFKTTKPSLIQMVGQEVAQTPYLPRLKKNPKKYLSVVLAAVIAAAAVAGAAFLLVPPKQTSTAQKLVPPAPFFAAETSRTISANSADRNLFLKLMEDSNLEQERAGTVKRILVKLQDGPQERFATLDDFLTLYKITPPANFLNNLIPPLMLFFYSGGDGNRFGWVIRTKDPDRTLKDMISWEPSMLHDFSALFFDEKPDIVIAPFEDRTYRNIDWRFLKLSQTKDLGIGYAIFPAGNVLVFTTSREAMETIINRLYEAQ